jgi:hypothetical protein
MATFGFPVGLVCAERHSCPAGIGPVGADRSHCRFGAVRSVAPRAARQGRRLGGARRDGAGGSRSGLAGGPERQQCRHPRIQNFCIDAPVESAGCRERQRSTVRQRSRIFWRRTIRSNAGLLAPLLGQVSGGAECAV